MNELQRQWAEELEIAAHPDPADWIAPRLQPSVDHIVPVGSVIPTGFEAYVRISHAGPGAREDLDVEGSLPQPMAESLVAVLTAGNDGQKCWLAIWEGWGDLPPAPAVVRHPVGRNYVLASAPVRMVARPMWSIVGLHEDYQSPSLWWPPDHRWCVATEIDFAWTYVGGSASLIAQLVAVKQWSARRVDPADDANIPPGAEPTARQ